MFIALIVGGFLWAWLPRQDKGPTLTDYGRAMLVADSLARPDSLPPTP